MSTPQGVSFYPFMSCTEDAPVYGPVELAANAIKAEHMAHVLQVLNIQM
jgi:hypothetical protein